MGPRIEDSKKQRSDDKQREAEKKLKKNPQGNTDFKRQQPKGDMDFKRQLLKRLLKLQQLNIESTNQLLASLHRGNKDFKRRYLSSMDLQRHIIAHLGNLQQGNEDFKRLDPDKQTHELERQRKRLEKARSLESISHIDRLEIQIQNNVEKAIEIENKVVKKVRFKEGSDNIALGMDKMTLD